MYIAWLLDNPNFPISDLSVQFDPISYTVTEGGPDISQSCFEHCCMLLIQLLTITTTGSAIRE